MRERHYFHFKEALVISRRSRLIGSFTGMANEAAALTGSLMAAVIVGTNIETRAAKGPIAPVCESHNDVIQERWTGQRVRWSH